MAADKMGQHYVPTAEEMNAFMNVLLDKDMPLYIEKSDGHDFVEQNEDEHVAPMFYFAEHPQIGNTIHLPDHDSAGDHTAAKNPFTLQNGLVVTYRDINALSGDYFGLMTPVSRGATQKDRLDRFQQNFNLLNNADIT